ncbi:hypothetical protein WA026_013697 [Henosepilachna vigintioctopunctata]|uniref:Disease resistance R13L4/SHOC-2-like LRR domain-containing protein n=1 Tax=Henosepilachna vigintioctopunctata TaxID=420089 RepID=A0AAW1V186_9CUCU
MNPMYDFIQRNRVLAKIEKAQHSKASNLALDDFDLYTLPDVLLTCLNLSSLNLGHNRLTSLPTALFKLKNLQNISLEYNSLDKFPEVLQDLPHLKTLNISHNPIRNLAPIGNLVNLEVLWCNSCCLSSIPEEIGKLIKLDTLGARHNQISNLPKSICNLEKLRWLTLEDNKLHMLPKRFECLQELVHLNLNKNNFSYIPVQLTKLKNLRYLHLQSNEFYSIPELVINNMEYVKINLLQNPLSSSQDMDKLFPNLVLPGKELEYTLDDLPLDSDSSSDDWENSLGSSQLNYSLSESDSDEEEVLIEIPKLSKYLVTF